MKLWQVPFFDGKTIILNAADGGAPGSPKVKIELRFHDEDGNELSSDSFASLDERSSPVGVSGRIISEEKKLSVKKDLSFDIIKDFLSGDLCLHGVSCPLLTHSLVEFKLVIINRLISETN